MINLFIKEIPPLGILKHKVKLYYFQKRLSPRYNIILKLLSLFHVAGLLVSRDG